MTFMSRKTSIAHHKQMLVHKKFKNIRMFVCVHMHIHANIPDINLTVCICTGVCTNKTKAI